MQLENSVAVITGGASGLGEATVRKFHSMGAMVSIFDMNDEAGEALVKELGGSVIYQHIDVASEASVKAGLESTLREFGAIHICCNFAGIGYAHKVVGRDGAHNLNDFQKVLDVNLSGSFNMLRLVALAMSKTEPYNEDGSRGVIINTASVAAYEGQMGQAAYSASKGGVVALTLPAARDLASVGIRVNTIVPGMIETPLMQAASEPVKASLLQGTLHPKRFGRPEEIASLAVFMVENEYINAECVRLDAGIRMQPR
ncbi:SDR family oxidoreductase [Pseudomaricurvus alkylphenolicus]|uniref:SDR family NAD(P)-dependent oxidoreductase n=1 Tax=Pseudomaricurvus alkylphenolicus TaxID=1306991 RepID=UPI001420F14C|nr:SDR family NAD(P)-dependent oxidoreductase [Pseudomaricurvus alkylphenolicus]NIB42345.1 SDR family oxidoreductase [Pseudomaricurvus alkylphenolicus]